MKMYVWQPVTTCLEELKLPHISSSSSNFLLIKQLLARKMNNTKTLEIILI